MDFGHLPQLPLEPTSPVFSLGQAYYNVYRDQGLRQALFQLIGTTQTPFFNDTGLDAGRAYGYQADSEKTQKGPRGVFVFRLSETKGFRV